jgi:pyridinium-3,5-bisthiocarboxylic acid mononucleotide nickel chelatase
VKAVYFDCVAGASGDMILGALLDAGLKLPELEVELSKLPLKGYRIISKSAQRGVLRGTQVTVNIEKTPTSHTNLRNILTLLDTSTLSPKVKTQASTIFKRLADAEGRVHGISPEEVHFHEVGAVDSIVDVVGSVIGLELLGVEALYSSPLPSGDGQVSTQHGVFPIPAPATLELLAMAHAPIRVSHQVQAELVTPTGAAIITTLASFECPHLTLESIGYGVGTRQLAEIPNVLRIWVGQLEQPSDGEMLLLECNIDDMNPQLYGHVMEKLFSEGARDVWFTPIQMKKNRPAVMLSVLVTEALHHRAVDLILRETSTLGLRVQHIDRHEAEREIVKIATSLGQVSVKVKRLGGVTISLTPEYDECRELALKHSLPLQEVYRIIATEANARLLPQAQPR